MKITSADVDRLLNWCWGYRGLLDPFSFEYKQTSESDKKKIMARLLQLEGMTLDELVTWYKSHYSDRPDIIRDMEYALPLYTK